MKIRKNIAISDTGFLFNPSTGDSYSLNPMGQKIVKYIQDNKSDDEIIELITEEYMVDNASVETDLYDFKQMLDNYKLSE